MPAPTEPVDVLPPLPSHEQARADFHALIAALLLRPSAALVLALTQARGLPDPAESRLSRAWQAMLGSARRVGPQAVLMEHEALFSGVGAPLVDPYGSRYLGGFLMDEPLARLRTDLRRLGLAQRGDAAVTEDHLGALCEALRLMITGAPGLPRQPLAAQSRFFDAHLRPWAAACLDDLRRAEGACFYAALADLADAFFDVEAAAFELDDHDLPEPHDDPALHELAD